MNTLLLAAAVASLAVAAVHVIVGGRVIAAPLLRADGLRPVPRFTNYYCWHMVSIVLLAMAGCYAWAGMDAGAVELAVLATGLALAFMAWGLGLILWKRQRTRHMPQWLMFAAVSGLGLAGLWAGAT